MFDYVYGIGIDIVKTKRWERACARYPDRVWRRVCGGQRSLIVQPSRVARIFAVKEAFAKAAGLGLRYPAVLSAMQVTHDAYGKPSLLVYGDLAAWIDERRLSIHVSVSDDGDYAIAQVLLARFARL